MPPPGPALVSRLPSTSPPCSSEPDAAPAVNVRSRRARQEALPPARPRLQPASAWVHAHRQGADGRKRSGAVQPAAGVYASQAQQHPANRSTASALPPPACHRPHLQTLSLLAACRLIINWAAQGVARCRKLVAAASRDSGSAPMLVGCTRASRSSRRRGQAGRCARQARPLNSCKAAVALGGVGLGN